MKLTVSCQICGRILAISEKDDFSDSEISMYENSCSCEIDGPFPQYDDEGDLLPPDTSNIIAVKTK